MVGPLVRQPDFLTLGVAAAASRLISARPSSYRGSATFRCTATGSACRRTRPHPLQEVTWRLRGKAHSPGLPRHGGSTESVGSGGTPAVVNDVVYFGNWSVSYISWKATSHPRRTG
jgi:hypothetical protein